MVVRTKKALKKRQGELTIIVKKQTDFKSIETLSMKKKRRIMTIKDLQCRPIAGTKEPRIGEVLEGELTAHRDQLTVVAKVQSAQGDLGVMQKLYRKVQIVILPIKKRLLIVQGPQEVAERYLIILMNSLH